MGDLDETLPWYKILMVDNNGDVFVKCVTLVTMRTIKELTTPRIALGKLGVIANMKRIKPIIPISAHFIEKSLVLVRAQRL